MAASYEKMLAYFTQPKNKFPSDTFWRHFITHNLSDHALQFNVIFIILNTSDINLSYENFMKTINSEIDNHIPLCNIKNKYKQTPRLPWITKSLLRPINRNNYLFYKYRSYPTDKSRQKYVSYKNTPTKLLRIQKKNYYVNQINKYKNDIINTWKTKKMLWMHLAMLLTSPK